MSLDPRVAQVTRRIEQRSQRTRGEYLGNIEQAIERGPYRASLSCGNLAHAFACSLAADKTAQTGQSNGNVGIVTAYNDMLSAHHPYGDYPEMIKTIARERGGTAQVAGGVPAMCDGVTQGQPGMELSLFSRDVIALSAAVALSHDVYDGAVFLGICDKIVPGLVMAVASFGHLPCLFLPSGPMTTGISNDQKSKIRQKFAAGEVGEDMLLRTEMSSYHSAGTCTFYGTANTNQMLMEFIGLQLPGSSFEHPYTASRDAYNRAGILRLFDIMHKGSEFTPAAEVLDIPNFVNAIVGLLASGGSTNELLHLVAMARAAGILLDLQDFADLSEATPLLARVYPNGKADVNDFHAAGGLQFLISELLEAGLLHDDVKTICGRGMTTYAARAAFNEDGTLTAGQRIDQSANPAILASTTEAFQATGGLRLLNGNLGRAIIKVSALDSSHHVIEAPARVFDSQHAVKDAFNAGELNRDVVCVVRFQGPRANGMPELHALTPVLGLLQDQGYRVALVSDGRMSGASGKVPAAIHLAPEACAGGAIACIRDGDLIRLDADAGVLEVRAEDFAAREPVTSDLERYHHGVGRELFATMRRSVGSSTQGASFIFGDIEHE